MVLEVVQVVEVINIIDFNLVSLTLLEVVLDIKSFNPVRVEAVHDDLGHAKTGPSVACFSEEHNHAVCARERVQVGQVAAFKR